MLLSYSKDTKDDLYKVQNVINIWLLLSNQFQTKVVDRKFHLPSVSLIDGLNNL